MLSDRIVGTVSITPSILSALSRPASASTYALTFRSTWLPKSTMSAVSPAASTLYSVIAPARPAIPMPAEMERWIVRSAVASGQ
jgi:hypothetical protein